MSPQHHADGSNDLSRHYIVLIVVAYLLLTLLATYPLLWNWTTAVPSDIGDPLLNTWIVAWDVHALLTDPLHLFEANIYFPLKHTLAYSEHLLGTALTVAPILLVSGEPVLAYNVAFALSFVLSGLGMYLLTLRLTARARPSGASRLAAFLAGIGFAFAPYRLAAMSHLQLMTGQWLPFALFFLDDFLRRRRGRSLALCALFLILQAASSWHLAVFAAFTAFIYAGGWWLAGPRSWPTLGRLALAALIVALVVAPLALPYIALIDELRAARPLEVAASFAPAPGDYLAAAPFNRLFGSLTAPLSARPGFTEEHYLFCGFLAPLLALGSLLVLPSNGFSRYRRRRAILLWIVFLAALVLTIGPGATATLPYAWLSRLLPVMTLIRVPPRWMVAALTAMGALGAYSLARILAGRGAWRYVLAALLGLGLFAEGFSAPIPLARVGNVDALPPCYHWLAQDKDDFALLEIPFYSAPRPEYPESKRLYASTIHWKKLVNGYSGMTPARQMALDRELADFPGERSLAAIRELGIRYVVVHSLEEGFDRATWEGEWRWQLARSLTLRPVYAAAGDYVYQVNPYGQEIVTAPQTVDDPRWRERLPHPVTANFGGLVELLAYQLQVPGTSEVPGTSGELALTLYWRALKPVGEDYTVFVHLVDEGGNIVAQGDGPPVEGHWPTTAWQVGEIVPDEHRLAAEAKGVRFLVGLYRPDTMARLPVVDEQGREVADHVALTVLSKPANK